MAQCVEKFKTLEQALDARYRAKDLKMLASSISYDVPTRKADIIATIVSVFHTDMTRVLKKLPDICRQALAETVHAWNGVYHHERFMAKYAISPFDYEKRESVLISLFIINDHIPVDLAESLKDMLPKPPAEVIHYGTDDDIRSLTVRETVHAALNNLNLVLGLVEEQKIKVSNTTGKPTAATVKAISRRLYDGDWYDGEGAPGAMQAFAWPLLLQGGGLAKPHGTILTLTRAGTAARRKGLADAVKGLWHRWETKGLIDEFSRVTAVKGQKSAKGRTMTAPAKRRALINKALFNLEPGKWVSVDELARFMVSRNLFFAIVNYE